MFMLVLGLTVAMAIQVVGALLVLSLLVTPSSSAACEVSALARASVVESLCAITEMRTAAGGP